MLMMKNVRPGFMTSNELKYAGSRGSPLKPLLIFTTQTRLSAGKEEEVRRPPRRGGHPGEEATQARRPPRRRGHPGEEATQARRPPRRRGHPVGEAISAYVRGRLVRGG
jgi:hypothetical protein